MTVALLSARNERGRARAPPATSNAMLPHRQQRPGATARTPRPCRHTSDSAPARHDAMPRSHTRHSGTGLAASAPPASPSCLIPTPRVARPKRRDKRRHVRAAPAPRICRHGFRGHDRTETCHLTSYNARIRIGFHSVVPWSRARISAGPLPTGSSSATSCRPATRTDKRDDDGERAPTAAPHFSARMLSRPGTRRITASRARGGIALVNEVGIGSSLLRWRRTVPFPYRCSPAPASCRAATTRTR